MKKSKQGQLILVKQVLWGLSIKEAKARDLLTTLNKAPHVPRFSPDDIEYICSALVQELTGTGLDQDFEPTERGLQIEAAIDWVRAHRYADRDQPGRAGQ